MTRTKPSISDKEKQETRSGKEFTSVIFKEKTLTPVEFMLALEKDFPTYAKHQFIRHWQKNVEVKCGDLIKTAEFGKMLLTVSDFAMGLPVKFDTMCQSQWFSRKIIEMFVSYSRHNENLVLKTIAHIVFSDSKSKSGDDVNHYWKLILQRFK